MMQKANASLSRRIAEEAQLLAEEKWIIDALRKVKQQRNSLQIERLHLENLRATVNKEELRNHISTVNDAIIAQTHVLEPPPSQTVLPQTDEEEERAPVTTLSHFDMPVAGIDDEMCNNEQLNLSVTNSVFTNQQLNVFDMEEDDDDMDQGLEDDEDMENCLIEMNMLMQDKS